MDPIAIHLKDHADIDRRGEPLQLGLPLPKGAFIPGQTPLYLVQQSSGESVPFQYSVTSHWKDGSVRWLTLRCLAHLAGGASDILTLQPTPPHGVRPPQVLSVDRSKQGNLTVSTGTSVFRLSSGCANWQRLPPGHHSGASIDPVIDHALSCQDMSGAPCTVQTECDWTVLEQGQLVTVLEFQGRWIASNAQPLARFQCRLEFFASSPHARLEVCLHNPQRAQHPGGLWDLGDPGSVGFRHLGVEITTQDAQRAWLLPEPDATLLEATGHQRLSLHQESSGGDAWDSPNHIDASGNLTPRFRGYRIAGAGDYPISGRRAQPVAGIEGPQIQVQLAQTQFWQNFPSSLEARAGQLCAGLFPATESGHELQGGERKTQTLWLNYSSEPDSLNWVSHPLRPTLSALTYQQAAALPWFQADIADGPLESLIRAGLDGADSFFAKREIIDEYGWRHFGDIFADHETLYQSPGEAPLISHYNNQYDALYGFARQFALSGDPRWLELMDDLARHVTDIDIYHTDQDRPEYNHGLFWHTDHYLPAHTATHRTFSRHNTTSSTPGQTGGGPAAEHCYTTGLLYHHYLTGSGASRQAVLDLASWMKTIHEGQGGLLEQLLALKKQDLPKARALLRGEKPLPYTYPFTRGTGNYLNALLDAWQLEPDQDWLALAEKVIRHTIHPADDIAKRQLLDVETGWSYLVLLASLSRYLWLKEQADELDDNYHYTREAFLGYSQWMLNNERCFLDDPDQLEFPNDTWTAQDIRKAMLLYQAATMVSADQAAAYRQQADRWLSQVCQRLSNSRERHYSRILIILMQNHGPHQFQYQENPLPGAISSADKAPTLTWFTLSSRVIGRLLRGLAGFRPARERAWLNARLNRS